jgi:hypothetical protein
MDPERERIIRFSLDAGCIDICFNILLWRDMMTKPIGSIFGNESERIDPAVGIWTRICEGRQMAYF